MVLRVGDFVCRSCGTTYRLDGSTGCPLVALDADFSGAVLHIKRNDQATDGRRVM
jgi:hypothetical protein